MSVGSTPHTVKAFDQELAVLTQTIARMGGLAETQLGTAVQALLNRDEVLARQVVETDDKVDGAEDNINEQVVRLLALRQPVADDLRLVMSSLRVASALERIADHAASTAHRVATLNQCVNIPAVKTVARLGWLVLELLKDALDSFVTREADAALRVWERDEEVDDLYSSLFRELLTYMMEDPRHITPCIHLLFIAKNLERVGDHATNLAETTWFVVNGKPLRQTRPKNDSSAYAVAEPRHLSSEDQDNTPS